MRISRWRSGSAEERTRPTAWSLSGTRRRFTQHRHNRLRCAVQRESSRRLRRIAEGVRSQPADGELPAGEVVRRPWAPSVAREALRLHRRGAGLHHQLRHQVPHGEGCGGGVRGAAFWQCVSAGRIVMLRPEAPLPLLIRAWSRVYVAVDGHVPLTSSKQVRCVCTHW